MSMQGFDALAPVGFKEFLLRHNMGIAPLKKSNRMTGLYSGTDTTPTSYQVYDVKQEYDLAAVIQAMNTPEDIFQREERWILAGGDCLFSEFEQKTEFPVHTHEDNTFAKLPLWVHIPLNYKVLTIGAVVYFVYHFFASFL